MPESEYNHFTQSICDNCGTELEGEYCHHCGQRKINFKKDWKAISHDTLASLFNLEGKTARGVLALAFYPGKLTRAFLDGKRASQIPPLRSYLLISLIFFFTLSQQENFVTNPDEVRVGVEDSASELTDDDGEQEDEFEVWVRDKIQKRDFILKQFITFLPKAFLIGVLVLAFFLRVVMFRTGHLYIEHLVTALNLQSFIFLWGTLLIGWSSLIRFVSEDAANFLVFILSAWFWICPILTIRQAYRASIKRTLIASFLIVNMYLFYLLFATISTLFLSAYFS